MTEETEAETGTETETKAAPGSAAERVSQLEEELAALKDRQLRLAAEFDNYRKRVAREHTETIARAQSSLLARFADILDDLDRFAHHSETATKEALLEGFELVERKIRGVLEGAGLEKIDPAGAPFDPNTMEALTSMPTDNPEEDDTVGSVFQPGYRYHGTLIRPARVVVRKYGAA